MRQLAWLCLALAFLGLGADAYWSWKGGDFTFRPIAFYVDLADPGWSGRVEHVLPHPLAGFLAAVSRWPVWVFGFGLAAIAIAVEEGGRGPVRRGR